MSRGTPRSVIGPVICNKQGKTSWPTFVHSIYGTRAPSAPVGDGVVEPALSCLVSQYFLRPRPHLPLPVPPSPVYCRKHTCGVGSEVRRCLSPHQSKSVVSVKGQYSRAREKGGGGPIHICAAKPRALKGRTVGGIFVVCTYA